MIQFVPDTKETRYAFQIYARESFILKMLQDISVDMEICEIEGWDKTEYIRRLREVLTFKHLKETEQNEKCAD